jgi:hypothetical protein
MSRWEDGAHETEVLRLADLETSMLDQLENEIRRQSLELCAEEAGLFQEALTLLQAGVMITTRPGAGGVQSLSFLGLGAVLWHLLRDGWNGILSGHYPAAIHSVRLIGEVSDHIVACSLFEDGARQILSGEEWKIGLAAQRVEAAFQARDPLGADIWARRRKAFRDDTQAVAHTNAILIKTAIHRGEKGTVYFGLERDAKIARFLAYLYVEAAVYALVSVGTAQESALPDGLPWSIRQRALYERWETYKALHPVEQLLTEEGKG